MSTEIAARDSNKNNKQLWTNTNKKSPVIMYRNIKLIINCRDQIIQQNICGNTPSVRDVIKKNVNKLAKNLWERNPDETSEGSYGQDDDYTPSDNESPGITYKTYNDFVSAKRKHKNEHLISTGLLEAKEALNSCKPPPKKKSHREKPQSTTTTRSSPRVSQLVNTYTLRFFIGVIAKTENNSAYVIFADRTFHTIDLADESII
eukprot:scaffold78747_cov20-Cyclotella_meneghiniana.AAC.2